ncbi:MAG: hypothetical protein JRI67_11875 [Deltaproteobacteria bacterium]|nr:hypothetical protein [Deltaproteobacteria bacterium]
MIDPSQALSVIPEGLRTLLLDEYSSIVNNFMERRWGPSELSGGRFCEIVYTILNGHASGTYPSSPNKPRNFVDACRMLENNSSIPRSFQILIPRLLPALYEIRNNRNVGHVGGDVNPDLMDSSAVVSIASWILAEIVRVLHGVSTQEAQQLVDNLAEHRHPIVWKSGDLRRVLDPNMALKDQIMILLSSCSSRAKADDLFNWTGYGKRGYFNRLLRQLHAQRFLEFYEDSSEVEILPPGSDYVAAFLQSKG